ANHERARRRGGAAAARSGRASGLDDGRAARDAAADLRAAGARGRARPRPARALARAAIDQGRAARRRAGRRAADARGARAPPPRARRSARQARAPLRRDAGRRAMIAQLRAQLSTIVLFAVIGLVVGALPLIIRLWRRWREERAARPPSASTSLARRDGNKRPD